MHESVNKLISIQQEINSKNLKTRIIAVSKTFPLSEIIPLINYGHVHFGENKVQESIDKWSDIKKNNNQIKLHMIGKLQTNKVKYAVDLFDYIHSVDNLKLAEKISNEQIKQNKKVKLFIQINIGDEPQKSGVSSIDIGKFYKYCTNDFGLDVVGLMCLPPADNNSSFYFNDMNVLNNSFSLPELSMGMSSDYIEASKYSATYLRIGSSIFGERF